MLLGTLLGCLAEDVPAGRILVKNDSQDKNYNVLSVYGGGARHSLQPGDSVILPQGTRSITFSRRYADHTKNYIVECPTGVARGISIKLIDVHVNRIAGGCKTVDSYRS